MWSLQNSLMYVNCYVCLKKTGLFKESYYLEIVMVVLRIIH